MQLQQIVRKLPVSDHVGMYAVNLARSSRPEDEIAPKFTKEYVNWGAGTRAVQYLVLGAKARAAIARRVQRDLRPRPRGGAAGAAAPHHDELPRRSRGHDAGQDRQATAGSCERAAAGRLQIAGCWRGTSPDGGGPSIFWNA